MEYLTRNPENITWLTLLLTGCFVLLTFAKMLYPRRFQEFVQLPVTNKYFVFQGKGDQVFHPFNILLFAVQVISVSVFGFLLLKHFNPAFIAENSWVFVQICTAFTVFVLVKFLIERLLGIIFNIEKTIDQYLYEKLTYRNLIAILFFIACLFFLYVTEIRKSTVIIFLVVVALLNCIALFYSYKRIQNLISANLFYFILYLCALEISPYLILYKMAV